MRGPINTLFNFLFHQPFVYKRLALVRISLAVVVLMLMLVGDYDVRFYAEMADVMYRPDGFFFWIPNLGWYGFAALKTAMIGSAVWLLVGYKTRPASVCFAIAYLLISRYNTFFDSYWLSYVTHLNFFSLTLMFTDTGRAYSLDSYLRKSEPVGNGREMQTASFILGSMQIYLAVFYFQTFLAKTLNTGLVWFVDYKSVYYPTVLYGTDFGHYLTRYPWAFTVIGLATMIIEGGFLFAFMYKRKWHPYLAVIATGFHIGIGLIMGISFYMLWLIYPALFIAYNTGKAQEAAAPAPLQKERKSTVGSY